ncbi:MAG: hypothetical protein AB8G77_09795 [Rhodothermales bacterium]
MRSLKTHGVEYLLVGGYAVGYHGYPRATSDIDVWVKISTDNSKRIVDALVDFGFGVESLDPELFLKEERIVRMGNAPLRIEIMMEISGVEFDTCYQQRVEDNLEGVEVSIIGLDCLKKNKKASGRLKDLSDLEYLSR